MGLCSRRARVPDMGSDGDIYQGLVSSTGRALHFDCRCNRFESCTKHQGRHPLKTLKRSLTIADGRSAPDKRAVRIHSRGQAPWGLLFGEAPRSRSKARGAGGTSGRQTLQRADTVAVRWGMRMAPLRPPDPAASFAGPAPVTRSSCSRIKLLLKRRSVCRGRFERFRPSGRKTRAASRQRTTATRGDIT